MGLDPARLARRGIVHACGWVSLRRPPVTVCRMVHVALPTDFGFEMRSRYWIGSRPRLRTPFGDVGVGALMRRGPLGKPSAVAAIAYDQLLHDQTEFTHLASFLAPLHEAFGRGAP